MRFNGSVNVSTGTTSSVPLISVTLSSLYPTNGSNWNDYVENNGTTYYDADDTACDGDAFIDGGVNNGTWKDYDACMHGGELRKVPLTSESSCTGITTVDALGAFDWACDDSGTVFVYSTGLKSGKKLADLLSTSGWLTNYVTISKSGTATYQSDALAWWTNPVHDMSTVTEALGTIIAGAAVGVDNGVSGALDVVTLTEASAIYYIGTSRSTVGYNLTASKSAVVVKPGATLTYAWSGRNNIVTATGVVGNGAPGFVGTGSTSYHWFEGKFDGALIAFNRGLYLYSSKFNQIRDYTINRGGYAAIDSEGGLYSKYLRVVVSNGSGWGIALRATSDGNIIDDANVFSQTSSGINLNAASRNKFRNIKIANGGAMGIQLEASVYNSSFYNINSSNNATAGIVIAAGTYNSFINLVLNNNLQTGIVFNNGSKMTFSHVTSMSNGQNGYYVFLSADSMVTAQGIFSNNTQAGISLWGGTNNQFINVATTNNSTYSVNLNTVTNTTFKKNLIVGNSTTGQCIVSAGSGNNISTDGGSICGGDQAGMTVADTNAVNLSTSFVGLVSTDSTNAHDASLIANGYLTWASITDWTTFSNRFRAWGKGTSATLFNAGARSRCTTGVDCRVWDLSLLSTSPLINVSETGSSANTSSGSNCPDAVQGDFIASNKGATEVSSDGIGNDNGTCDFAEACTTEVYNLGGNNNGTCDGGETCVTNDSFLVNATEIIGDGIGDDDGFCESNESCIYSPNIGAYQGHGTVTAMGCDFVDGVTSIGVTGVTMYQYSTNGY